MQHQVRRGFFTSPLILATLGALVLSCSQSAPDTKAFDGPRERIGTSEQGLTTDTTGTLTADRTFHRPYDAKVSGYQGTRIPPFQIDTQLYSYYTKSFTPSVTGAYDIETPAAAFEDTFLVLYETSFDPANPLTNAIALEDDTATLYAKIVGMTLDSTKKYIIVVTSYGTGSVGFVDLRVTGPGTVTFWGSVNEACDGSNPCDSTLACVASVCSLTQGQPCGTSLPCANSTCVDGYCCDTACGGGVGTDCQACNVAGKLGICSNPGTPACTLDPNGTACSAGGTCLSGNCVDNVCCNTACGGGAANDCQACNLPGNGGTCSFESSTTVCRASGGDCDVAETCTGSSAGCPSDSFEPSSKVCRASNGVCDKEEKCTGSAAACPSDTFLTSTTVCRPSAGVCDVDESCTGSAAACPSDSFLPSSSVCRASGGVCDTAENCTGSAAACPGDAKLPSSTLCRASGGVCDVDDFCDGSTNDCTADVKKPSSFNCRASVGLCDVDDFCDGTNNACTADVRKPFGFKCRAGAGACDLEEFCDGTDNQCPVIDAKRPFGSKCRPATAICDAEEVCDGTTNACPEDKLQVAGYKCRASIGACDAEESCSGVSPNCPADSLQPAGYKCKPAQGPCDVEEECSGTTYECPADVVRPAGSTCRYLAGPCDVEEKCDGLTAACATDAKLPAGTSCRAASGICDVEDKCDGTTDDCADQVASASTSCRGAAGSCDQAEQCDGLAKTCPNDVYLPTGTTCAAGSCTNGIATIAAQCSGSTTSCPATTTQNCSPYGCGTNACATTCVTSNECAPGAFCENNVCSLKADDGVKCTSTATCKSGNCVDGVCCESACDKQCQACAEKGTEGKCTGVIGKPREKRAACASDGTDCGGACDGTKLDACVYPASAKVCRAGSCATGIATLQASCDGAGSCPTVQTLACTPYPCAADGTKCQGNCTVDGDCADPAKQFCGAGVCTNKLDKGLACASSNQCANGPCVDGYCCEKACDGQCEACDVAGLLGTCSPVKKDDAPHGGIRKPCDGTGSCAGACDGTITTACAMPGSEKECKAASCTNGAATAAATCDSKGACGEKNPVSCDGYVCTGAVCAVTCTVKSDCQTEYECTNGLCKKPEPDAGPDGATDAQVDGSSDAPSDVAKDTSTDAKDSGADVKQDVIDSGKDTGTDTGKEAGADTGIDAKDSGNADASKDGSVDGSAGASSDAGETEGGGCGCKVAGEPSKAPTFFGLTALLALLGLRRKNRKS